MKNKSKPKGNLIPRATVAKAFAIYFSCALVIAASVILRFALIDKIKTKYSALSLILIAVVTVGIITGHFVYVVCGREQLIRSLRTLGAVYTAMTISVVTNIYLELISPYLMPAMLTALIVATLTTGRETFVASIFANVLVFFVLMTKTILLKDDGTDISAYAVISAKFAQGLIGSAVVSYWISNDTKRLRFIWKGLVVALLSVVAVYMVSLVFGEMANSFVHIIYLLSGAIGQVLIAFVLQPVFESAFNLVTNTRLVELTDLNMPLIKRLKEDAPGTFSHCLAVANFAEVCASAIGENPYLARACAYYHDVGKLKNPQYFKENQAEVNPHDGLLPEVSVEIIRSHCTEGKRLCDEYRIPREVSDVTIQHHGTLPIYIFYNKAKQLTDGEVNVKDYSYNGITPVSKIAAIIMLCDSGEAAIRAMDNPNPEKVDGLLRKLISDRIAAGQFDNCEISLHDLDIIRKTIVNAYGGQFHKRLKYPGGEK